MKKRFLLILLLCLSACALLNAQDYTSYSVSSNFGNLKIDKDAKILVVSESNNYYFNRVVEQAVFDEFVSNGFSVICYSDKYDFEKYYTTSDDVVIPWFDIMSEYGVFDDTNTNDAVRYFAFIYMETETSGSTFTYGGGIRNIDLTCEIVDADDMESIRILVLTEADKNDWLSFNATIPLFAKSFAKAFVDEYMKYCDITKQNKSFIAISSSVAEAVNYSDNQVLNINGKRINPAQRGGVTMWSAVDLYGNSNVERFKVGFFNDNKEGFVIFEDGEGAKATYEREGVSHKWTWDKYAFVITGDEGKYQKKNDYINYYLTEEYYTVSRIK